MTTLLSWYPPADKKPIPPGDNDPVIVPVMAILHVSASLTSSLFGWFNGPSKGVEAHFYIRKDGTVEQYRSVTREADANLGANSWKVGDVRLGAVSIETEGLGGGSWTRRQMKAIKALLLWLHTEHGIPLQVVRVPNPVGLQAGGVSYHSRFRSWSPVKKSCPGPKRIMQFATDIRAWMHVQRSCLHCPIHCPKEA